MDKKLQEELKWIDDEAIVRQRPVIDEFPIVGQRSVSEHVLKKMGENILVPLGLLATTACLTMGLVSLKRGNSARQQVFMRGRVGFQLFTLVTMTLGVYLTTKSSRKSKETKKESNE